MEDLLQSQIKDSCKLALPDGLQELMCDMSREVLRAQPNDLYSFIADYLSALLVTRENMSIVTRLCDDSCAGCCLPELEHELRYLGLDEEGAESAKDIIVEYFNRGKGTINEGNLIMKLMKKTNLDVDLLPQVQTAVHNAFQRHQANHAVIYETSSDSEKDEVERAASHTMQLYRKTNPIDEDLNQKAAKIQAAYRAYGVRRNRGKRQIQKPKISKSIRKNIKFEPSTKVHHSTQLDEKLVSSIYYENHNCIAIDLGSEVLVRSVTSTSKKKGDYKSTSQNLGQILVKEKRKNYEKKVISKKKKRLQNTLKDLNKVSSICLEGSYLHIPKHNSYSVHTSDESLSEVGENLEKEYEIDYAAEKISKVTELNEKRKVNEEHHREVGAGSFNYEIEDEATEADIDSEGSVHEQIQNESEENVLTDEYFK